jgi:galactokinase
MFKNVIDSRVLSESIASDPNVRAYFSSFDTSKDAIAFLARSSMTSEPLRNGIMNVQIDIKTHWFPSTDEKGKARLLAPYLANLFVHELDHYNRERLITTARYMREFTESEYNKRIEQLDSAYAHLQEFQETNNAVSLPEQLTATVTSVALLASQVQQLEMQIGVEERELTPNSARVAMLQAQLDEAKNQLKRYDDGSVGEYSIALTRVPELTRKLARLMREVKMLETISAYLRQQLEQERLNEQRNVPTFQMLDSAVLPLKKSSPKRSMVLILGVICGTVVSGIYIGWKRFKRSISESPEEHKRYLRFVNTLRRERS